MSELPVETGTDDVQAHPHKTGHRVVDFAIAGSALLISLVSLWVGIHHGHVQERLVAANSWPFLNFDMGGGTSDRGQMIGYLVANNGAGPAILKSLVVRYKGKPVRGWVELLQECCGLPHNFTMKDWTDDLGVTAESHPVGVIRAREEAYILRLLRKPSNAAVWDRFGSARNDLTFEACYCSIIGDCWKSNLKTLEPEPVQACKASSLDYKEFGAGLDESTDFPVLKR